jgi:hypothetical protein
MPKQRKIKHQIPNGQNLQGYGPQTYGRRLKKTIVLGKSSFSDMRSTPPRLRLNQPFAVRIVHDFVDLADPVTLSLAPRDRIRNLRDRIATHEVSFRTVTKTLRIGGPRLHKIFQDADRPLDLRSGRFPLNDRDTIFDLATEFLETSDISCGYRRIAESIAQEGRPPLITTFTNGNTPILCHG